MDSSDLAGERYVSHTASRRNGEAGATPVWITALGDGRIGVVTAASSPTATRIRHDPRLRAAVEQTYGLHHRTTGAMRQIRRLVGTPAVARCAFVISAPRAA